MKKAIIGLCVLLTIMLSLSGCGEQNVSAGDTVKYDGTEFAALEYPENVFFYDYNGNSHDNFEEVDGIYPIDSPNWEMIWNGGDLYCNVKDVDKANSYYADDENYVWYVLIDNEEYDEPDAWDLEFTTDEIVGIYGVESQEKDLAIFFDEIEKMGSLIKISEDSIIRGTISIGKYKGQWYWRTEIIDDSIEEDGTWPEYVIPLPESVNGKIIEVE